jgi:hypothetical protein
VYRALANFDRGHQSSLMLYSIDKAGWDVLRHNEVIRAEVKRCLDMLKEDCTSFKVKARHQSEELLKKSWEIIHDKTGFVRSASLS